TTLSCLQAAIRLSVQRGLARKRMPWASAAIFTSPASVSSVQTTTRASRSRLAWPSAWIGPARTTRGRSGLIGKISFGKRNPSRVPLFPSLGKGNPRRVPLFPSLSGTAAIIEPGLRRVISFGAMATLVTGAFGCIGSWVVRGLLADGELPVVYDLGDDPWRMRMIAGDDVGSRVALVRGDMAD